MRAVTSVGRRLTYRQSEGGSPSCMLVPMEAVMSYPTREASVTKLYPTKFWEGGMLKMPLVIGDIRTGKLTGDHQNIECLKRS